MGKHLIGFYTEIFLQIFSRKMESRLGEMRHRTENNYLFGRDLQ